MGGEAVERSVTSRGNHDIGMGPSRKKFFGTDGIRGVANTDLTAETAFKTGAAVGGRIGRGGAVLLGRDTRCSGEMLEAAVSAGLTSAGADVRSAGIVSTPAVSYLTRKLSCEAGVVISASHNPPEFNGIKVFDAQGFKYSDDEESAVELLINCSVAPLARIPGRIYRADKLWKLYADSIIELADGDLRGGTYVLDCAHGAACEAAAYVFGKLGARIVKVACTPSGRLVNSGVGATHPQKAALLARIMCADAAFCFDGDADRIIAADGLGNIADGDHILYLNACRMHGQGRLKGEVVATVLTNTGFERAYHVRGIGMARVKVGDKYVIEHMRNAGCNLGGEQSGHIIFGDYAATGDGLLAAVLTARLIREGASLSALPGEVKLVPQAVKNVTAPKEALDDIRMTAAVEDGAVRLRAAGGRLVVRPSGTEPKIRIMAECADAHLAREIADGIAMQIQMTEYS